LKDATGEDEDQKLVGGGEGGKRRHSSFGSFKKNSEERFSIKKKESKREDGGAPALHSARRRLPGIGEGELVGMGKQGLRRKNEGGPAHGRATGLREGVHCHAFQPRFSKRSTEMWLSTMPSATFLNQRVEELARRLPLTVGQRRRSLTRRGRGALRVGRKVKPHHKTGVYEETEKKKKVRPLQDHLKPSAAQLALAQNVGELRKTYFSKRSSRDSCG